MRILAWHVHGSWMTSFVAGEHDYVIPFTPDRGPDGLGRARTWVWPEQAREVAADRLRAELGEDPVDAVVLQRPHEAALVRDWTGLRVGHDVPAVYLEHNAPTGHAVRSEHPVQLDPVLCGLPVAHVTHFNAMAWDCGDARVHVVEHGIPDPGLRYTGEDAGLAAVVNEPMRRWRVAGTDLLLALARHVPTTVYGMGMEPLAEAAHAAGVELAGLHTLRQSELHERLGRHRAYWHPYRWTSLGLSLLEAMALGMPVLALAATEAPRAVPAEAGVVTNDLDEIEATARRWLADVDEARERGLAARKHVLAHYSLQRFHDTWDRIFQEVCR